MLIKAKWILPIASPAIEDGAIRVSSNLITDLGYFKDLKKKYSTDKIIDLKNSIIMPGFINAHSHIAYTILRGFLDKYDFWQWLKILNYLKYEILNQNDIIFSSLLGCLIAIRNGITTIADTYDSIVPFKVARQVGVRIIFYYEIFGWEEDKINESIHKAKEYLNNFSKPNESYKIGISPHSIYTVGPALFKHLNEFIPEETPLCIHLAESKEEAELIKNRKGKLFETMKKIGRDLTGNFNSFLGYLEQFSLLKYKPLVIHGVYLNKDDLLLLKKYDLAIIHCPSSNLKFGHGIAPIYELKQNNIKWGLGTDSLASNNRMDMIQEMRLTLFMQRGINKDIKAFTEEEILKASTITNAHLLNLDKLIGSIEINKRADLISIKLDNINNFPCYEPYTAIINNCTSNDVIFTMTNGKIKFYNNKFYNIRIPKNFYNRLKELENKIKKALITI